MRLFVLIYMLFVTVVLPSPAMALVTDLSNNKIEIRYSFDGAQLILFGAVGTSLQDPDSSPYEVVVVVRGPNSETVVRKKEKVGVIWVNKQNITFPSAPGYYAVAASTSLDQIAPAEVFEKYGIGFDYLPLVVRSDEGVSAPKPAFRDALFRLRSGEELFRQEQDSVTKLTQGLFRTDIYLPANVPVGDFVVETFLFQDGKIKDRSRIKLDVGKEGFERAAYDFAHGSPFLYGLTAVVVALSAGWLAGVLGKK